VQVIRFLCYDIVIVIVIQYITLFYCNLCLSNSDRHMISDTKLHLNKIKHSRCTKKK